MHLVSHNNQLYIDAVNNLNKQVFHMHYRMHMAYSALHTNETYAFCKMVFHENSTFCRVHVVVNESENRLY